VACQLIDDNHLVGVDPGQAIRRQTPHGIDESGFGSIPQGVKPGSVQPGSGVPVVAKFADQLMALGADSLAQRCQLRANGPACLLSVAGHPCIDRHSHRCTPTAAVISGPHAKMNS